MTHGNGEVEVRRAGSGDPSSVWCVTSPAAARHDRVVEERWLALAKAAFTEQPDSVSLSITPRTTSVRVTSRHWRADAPVGSLWFLNGRIADLIGLASGDDLQRVSANTVNGWIRTASDRGLGHLWCTDAETSAGAARTSPTATPSAPGSPISVGIDAAWLMAGESGAQVFVIEMLLALAARADIARIVLLSDAGRVPSRLQNVAKITGLTWADALAQPGPVVDVLHRPYQPDDQVDFARYRQVGGVVVMTLLDFIAYDIAAYHESHRAWRRHRARFDEQVALADGVFAISRAVARRADWQFGARLSTPAHAIELGTDHLDRDAGATVMPPALTALNGSPFLLVLGNDFAHKNRDFAVRVFAELCERGYQGSLVLAGFHLDCGSSYDYEITGAGDYASRIVRLAAVSGDERNWLLTHAEVVLYPTCAEGFGLVPFEAASFGTPAAFVRFGPLAETLPGVDAGEEWRVAPFADLVERLQRDPERQVASIRAAAQRLSWAHHATHVVQGYGALLAARSTHHRRTLPGPAVRAWRATQEFVDRLTAAVERRARRVFRFQSA